jgi:anaerobic magnesium-protoporphyrin IX monomethyl ester cyclase
MTLVTPMVREAYRLADDLRALGVKLLAGGPHATLLPEEAVAHGFDGAVVGEGEPTAAEAVAALLGRMPPDEVKGWVFRGPDGAAVRTEARPAVARLDDLPYPARHLVDPLDYGPADNPGLHVNLFTSRGCPARCSFCAGSLFGRRFRFRSPEGILDEMDQVHRAFGTRHFFFLDDAMTMDRDRVLRFCEGLRERRLPVTWSAMTRIDAVDEELLRRMAEAGCVKADYGVESGHPETLRRIRKPHTVEMVQRVIPATARAGIRPVVFFILGFPWEGPAEIDATLRLIKDLAPWVDEFHPAIASILVPFPKTEIYETYKDAYGFADWWLGASRNFESPREGFHSYFESRVFPLGAVLDADFFHYSAATRLKIFEVFKFFYLHNIRRARPASRLANRILLELSEKALAVSPGLERALFKPIVLPRVRLRLKKK